VWVPVATLSQTHVVSKRLNTGIVGSDPLEAMAMSGFVCVALSCVGRDFAMVWSLVKTSCQKFILNRNRSESLMRDTYR